MNNFWNTLERRPFFAMAPMADVTDAAFRQMFVKYGLPEVMWTEFVSADGLFLAPEQGRDFWLPDNLRKIAVKHGVAPDNPLLKDLIFSENEQPIVAQFFSRDPQRMERAARLAVDLGFTGVDINMGCPAKVIVNQGAGCAMIREPKIAREVIRACVRGAQGKIPVSVKTRTGFNNDSEMEEWVSMLLSEDIAALSIHARTRKDMSKVPARWENIAKVVELRNKISPATLIVGNGDVSSVTDGQIKAQVSGADGVMVGRGIFGNPWFFSDSRPDNLPERAAALIEHLELFDKYLLDTKSYAIMKKHFKSYLAGLTDTKSLRHELMETLDLNQAIEILSKHR